MSEQWQTTFHALVVGWYLLVDLYLALLGLTILFTRSDILFGQFGLGLQYLTLWNVFAQQGYFMLSLKEDFLPYSCQIKPKLHKFLTIVFHVLVFPLGFMVALDFWLLYKIDPALIDKFNALEDLLASANHAVHSTIVPIVILELIISDRPRKSLTLLDTLTNLLFFHLIYLLVVCFLYQLGGMWPYPFLDNMSLLNKILLGILNSIGGTAISAACYLIKSYWQRVFERPVKTD